jgi:hypothetical protein
MLQSLCTLLARDIQVLGQGLLITTSTYGSKNVFEIVLRVVIMKVATFSSYVFKIHEVF